MAEEIEAMELKTKKLKINGELFELKEQPHFQQKDIFEKVQAMQTKKEGEDIFKPLVDLVASVLGKTPDEVSKGLSIRQQRAVMDAVMEVNGITAAGSAAPADAGKKEEPQAAGK